MSRSRLSAVASPLVAAAIALGVGCGDDDVGQVVANTPETGASPEAGVADSHVPDAAPPVPPPVPTLGAQIDRIGRPLVNTLLIGSLLESPAGAGAKKQAYDADRDQAAWQTRYSPEIASNLALFDGFNGSCSDQLMASEDAGASTSIATYGALARMLADDRIWLDTAGLNGGEYLALEYDAAGLIPNRDRGGRELKHDVVDVTYSALAIGAISGLEDGIPADKLKTSGTSFPYLAPPK